MTTNYKIVASRIEDEEKMKAAFKIREVVYIEEQKVDRAEEFDEFEEECRHFLVEVNDMSAGTARWRTTDKGIKLERFAVLKEFRGKGIGSLLMEAVLEDIHEIIEDPKGICYLHAQLEAMPLYAKFGFEPEGEQFEECNIMHQTMVY